MFRRSSNHYPEALPALLDEKHTPSSTYRITTKVMKKKTKVSHISPGEMSQRKLMQEMQTLDQESVNQVSRQPTISDAGTKIMYLDETENKNSTWVDRLKRLFAFLLTLASLASIFAGLVIAGFGIITLPFGLGALPMVAGLAIAGAGGALLGCTSTWAIHGSFERGSNRTSAAIVVLGILGVLAGVACCLTGVGIIIGAPLIAGGMFVAGAGITKYKCDTSFDIPNNVKLPNTFDEYSNQEKLEYIDGMKQVKNHNQRREQQIQQYNLQPFFRSTREAYLGKNPGQEPSAPVRKNK